jgi:hypothetical protein
MSSNTSQRGVAPIRQSLTIASERCIEKKALEATSPRHPRLVTTSSLDPQCQNSASPGHSSPVSWGGSSGADAVQSTAATAQTLPALSDQRPIVGSQSGSSKRSKPYAVTKWLAEGVYESSIGERMLQLCAPPEPHGRTNTKIDLEVEYELDMTAIRQNLPPKVQKGDASAGMKSEFCSGVR